MPTLNWIGKEAVINHHMDVPFRTLEKQYDFGQSDSGNRIIHGDNLEALKSLMPEYEGRVKCIYIDPPYNTGNEHWVYNDNVNSPKIRKWLGQVVGKEAEDLTRHDKWLCMMYPRLKLLHKLLADDGAIFISIDDNEQANLKLICDEIFGAGNFVGQFIWVRKKKGSFLSKTLRKMTEYILCYKKIESIINFFGEKAYSDKWQPIVKRTNNTKMLSFPQNTIQTNLANGIYKKGFKGNVGTGVEFLTDIVVKDNVVTNKLICNGNFVWIQDFLDNEIKQGTTISLSTKFGFNVLRHNQSEKQKTPSTLINSENNVGTNEDASIDLQRIFKSGVNEVFSYSKPSSLVEYVINMILYSSPNSIILDSFAGSGTTAQAVLNLNKQDGGNRKFILVEMEDYAEGITAERVRRVINGYGEGKNAVEGTGGGFAYYELGETMFDSNGYLNENQPTERIRQYVFYTETGKQSTEDGEKPYFMGSHGNADYYFYYEKERITTLSRDTLHIVWRKADTYVIYADQCYIDNEELARLNIIFKKIPRDIRKV